ncbi:MAG: hypothetical protein K0Q85_32 [Caproiciproducens sp.]|jgi:uncharacterized protein (TIGR02217 family)|nr:hypothetical protein [Caproiciproducens sp.]
MVWDDFHEVNFPPDIKYGVEFGPMYSTDVVTTNSGGEQRNQNWNHPKYSGDASHAVKTRRQMQQLLAFFHARKGKAFGFRFKDWLDYKASDQLIGICTSAGQTFQLSKKYVDEFGYETLRPIYKPIPNKVIIYRNGVLQTTGWSMDYTTGIFTASITGTWRADFEFDVPVRFDTDEMKPRFDNPNVCSWEQIPIIEIRR